MPCGLAAARPLAPRPQALRPCGRARPFTRKSASEASSESTDPRPKAVGQIACERSERRITWLGWVGRPVWTAPAALLFLCALYIKLIPVEALLFYVVEKRLSP